MDAAKLKIAIETMECSDHEFASHPGCPLMNHSIEAEASWRDVDYMACGASREERHAVVASLILDGESL